MAATDDITTFGVDNPSVKPAAVAPAGSALLVAVAILHLPPPAALTRRVATPFDHTRDPGAAAAFVLFAQASTLIPSGSAVAVAAARGIRANPGTATGSRRGCCRISTCAGRPKRRRRTPARRST